MIYKQITTMKEGISHVVNEVYYPNSRENVPNYSTGYCCPNCGDLWAKIDRFISNSKQLYYFMTVLCYECGKNTPRKVINIPGSLYDSYLGMEQLNGLSEILLEREANILLELYDQLGGE